ncbi:MAG: 30S ribosomal protein S9 [Nanoarchaeota archaeon]
MTNIHVSGKRRKAIARATLRDGNGTIRINKVPLVIYEPAMARLKIEEPLLLAGDIVHKVNIDVNVHGGGQSGQAIAARLAVARALATKHESLRATFLDYDRTLLVADVRRNEPAKPNSHGKPRAKVQKSYR